MGQYFKPIILESDGESVKTWLYSHDYEETYKREDGSEFVMGHGLKLMEHSWMKNNFVRSFETLIANNPQRVVWSGDYSDKNTYELATDELKGVPTIVKEGEDFRFVINHSKECYVDKNEVPTDKDGWQIHPLPLLTCEGNGRGGGDYGGNHHLVGDWARDLISVSNEEPENFEKIEFDLVE